MYLTLKQTYALHRELWQRMINEVKTDGISKEKYYELCDLKMKCLQDMGYEKENEQDTSIKGLCFLCHYYSDYDWNCGDCPLRKGGCGLYFECHYAYSENDYENTLKYMEIIRDIIPTSYSEEKELGIV